MAAGAGGRRCRCGTRLAMDNSGSLCGACTRTSRSHRISPPEVPLQFWHDPALRAALARHDMGAVMHAYRTHPHHERVISQEIAAGWVGITQTRLSRIENGRTPVTNLVKLTHWARVLAIPPDLLWFAVPGTSSQSDLGRERPPQPQEATCGLVASSDTRVTQSAYERDEVNRRQLLRLVSVASAALTLEPAALAPDRDRLAGTATGRTGNAALDDHAALNNHLWQVYALSGSKAAVLPAARHQFDVLTTALAQPSSPATRTRLCELVANLLQLAGEVLFDGDAYTEAAHCYTLAAYAAQQADAYDLWACALTRHAFIALYDTDGQRAMPILDLAAHLAGRGNPDLSTRQWIATVQAHAHASQGDFDACRHALDTAQTVHDLPSPFQTNGWLRFDGSRLPEERGACYTRLGRPDLAQVVLTDALPHISSARRRGAILADLAITGAQQHDTDQLITHGMAAAHLAHQTGSGYLAHKLEALRPHLAMINNDFRVRDLRDRLPTVVRTSP